MATLEEYNAGRADRGRGPIAAATFAAMGGGAVFAKDLEGWLAGSTLVYAAKLALAAEVADYWKSIAPHWGDRDPKGAKPPTGLSHGSGVPNQPDDYEKSIKVFRKGDGVVEVGTELMPLAKFLEYGTEHNPEYACAARTLAHFGGGPLETSKQVSPGVFVG